MSNQKLDWKTWLKRGDQNLRSAIPKGEKSKFGTSIRYNLLSMSFEDFSMAMLDYHNSLPDNHTYTDLLNALEKCVPVREDLKNKILKYESIQSICSIAKYTRTDPTEEEIAELTEAVTEIKELAYKVCDQPEYAA